MMDSIPGVRANAHGRLGGYSSALTGPGSEAMPARGGGWDVIRLDLKKMRTFVGFDRIAVDPEILAGKPHVRGTRISVARTLEVPAQYPDRASLRADYPGLEDEAIRQVLAFAAASVDGRVIALDRTAA